MNELLELISLRAKIVASYYEALRKEGISEEGALMLTLAYQNSVIQMASED